MCSLLNGRLQKVSVQTFVTLKMKYGSVNISSEIVKKNFKSVTFPQFRFNINCCPIPDKPLDVKPEIFQIDRIYILFKKQY